MLAALAELGIEAERIPCDPEFADTAAFCARYGWPPEASANTILVAFRRPPNSACACVLLATTRLDVNHRVRDLLGAGKVSALDLLRIPGTRVVERLALSAGAGAG